MYQGLGESLVVRAILLAGAGGERDGDRPLDADPAQDGADEARDALVARELRLVLVRTLAEVAARLQEQSVERLRVAAVGMQHRERAEARAHADALAMGD